MAGGVNKQDEIVAMFDSIAGSYDVANRVLSAGVDIAWRKEACRLALDLVSSIQPSLRTPSSLRGASVASNEAISQSLDDSDKEIASPFASQKTRNDNSKANHASSAESPTSRHCETSRSEVVAIHNEQSVQSSSLRGVGKANGVAKNSATEGDALNASEESASGLSSGSPCCVTARNDDSKAGHAHSNATTRNDGAGENPPPQTAPDSTAPLNIIDIASGTGDMVLHWAAEAKKRNIPTQFSAIDPSVEMLKIGEKKINEAGISAKFITAKAQNLPLDSALADIISIAYGLRNVTDLDAALAEFFRLLKPGGILVILEFTRNDKPKLLDRLARLYTTRILPIIGGLISRNYAAYKYLPNSIDSFESLGSLCAKLRAAGLTPHTTKTYPANISSLIIAVKNH